MTHKYSPKLPVQYYYFCIGLTGVCCIFSLFSLSFTKNYPISENKFFQLFILKILTVKLYEITK